MKLPGGMNLADDEAGPEDAGADDEGDGDPARRRHGGRRHREGRDERPQEVLSVKIEPEAAGDVEMLQDLIVAAINECGRKVDESAGNRLGGVLGGLNIPGLM